MKKFLISLLACLCVGTASLGFVGCSDDEVIQGPKGEQGEKGDAGSDGEDGEDGITPQLKIGEDNYWYVSYDNAETWTSLGIKATGADGENGEVGATGVGIQSITTNTDGDFVVTYTNGTTQIVPAPGKHTHTFAEWKWYINSNQTCENSLFYHVCDTCGHIEWREGSSDDHKWGATVTTPPSCETIGFDRKVCETCEKVEESNYVNALGHSYEQGVCIRCDGLQTQGLTYALNGAGTAYTVTGLGTCQDASIFIPAKYNKLPVTAIGEEAFLGCYGLTSITIPDSVTTIGNYAFSESGLTSVVIGNSVTMIGEGAFEYCLRLVEVINKAPSITVTKGSTDNGCVGCYALVVYNSDSGVTESQLYNDNGYIVYIGGEEKILVGYNGTETDLTLPSYITQINLGAFLYCDNLTSVVIPDGVTTIGYGAFAYCDNLTSVAIPDSVTTMDDLAFAECRSLTSVAISNGVTSIGASTFHNCRSLVSVVIPDSVTSIGYGAFEACESLARVEIPDSVLALDTYAFSSCYSLTNVIIGGGVTSIGSFTFNNCYNLTSVEVSEDNSAYKDIDGNLYSKDGTFFVYYAKGKAATEFAIPDGVTTIGDSAFTGCDSLTSVVIPSSVTSIGDRAFSGCDSLTSVVIPSSVTSIGDGAFSGCASLTSVEIPDSVTSIGDFVFDRCVNLTYNVTENAIYLGNSNNPYLYLAYANPSSMTVTVEQGCKFIGSWAFYDCDNLISVVIPDGVTTIGERAFGWCTKLTNITFNGTVEEWNVIEKDEYWNVDVPATEVICDDGSVAI